MEDDETPKWTPPAHFRPIFNPQVIQNLPTHLNQSILRPPAPRLAAPQQPSGYVVYPQGVQGNVPIPLGQGQPQVAYVPVQIQPQQLPPQPIYLGPIPPPGIYQGQITPQLQAYPGMQYQNQGDFPVMDMRQALTEIRQDKQTLPLRRRDVSYFNEEVETESEDEERIRLPVQTTSLNSRDSKKGRKESTKVTPRKKVPVRAESSESESDEDLLPKVKVSESMRKGQPLSSSSRPQTNIQVSRNIRDFKPLGTFKDVAKTDPRYKTVSRYVYNSCDVDKFTGSILIHKLYELQKTPQSVSLTAQQGAPQMSLLWFKTCPASIKGIASKSNRCVSFYDRLGRLFPWNWSTPEEVKGSLQQIVLLCAVNLGNMHKSKKGYQHWKEEALPAGCNSIFAMGRRTPDWEDNREDGFVSVPSGKTKRNRTSGKLPLSYNEYIIYEAKRVEVMYAVNIEVKRSGKGRVQSHYKE